MTDEAVRKTISNQSELLALLKASKVMVVCEECSENNPEGCGHYSLDDLRETPDGRWLCQGCHDEDTPTDGVWWQDLPKISLAASAPAGDGGEVETVVVRRMDEIDAARIGHDWLNEIAAALPEHPSNKITQAKVGNDGGMFTLWHKDRVQAAIVTVRDDANFTQLLRFGPSEPSPSSRSETAWQPIETAPKDGTWILVPDTRYKNRVSGMVRWEDQKHGRYPKPYWSFVDERIHGVSASRANQPDVWQPMPAPPSPDCSGCKPPDRTGAEHGMPWLTEDEMP